MDNVRKKREGEDALAVSRLFDAYIKKTLKNNVKTARDARDRRNRVLLLPLDYLDEMAAPPYICKEEQTKVFLGDTMLYLDDEKLAEVITVWQNGTRGFWNCQLSIGIRKEKQPK